MRKPGLHYLLLAAAAILLTLTCGPIPPPAPDVDFATAQPEITIVPPRTAQTADTVGNPISIKVKLRYSSSLDSVYIIVKGKSSTGADTVEKSQRLADADFVGDSILISYLPLMAGQKTVSVTVWFPQDTKNTADYILNVVPYAPEITIVPPHDAQVVDTVRDVVTFGINHSHVTFLDSLVVQVKDSSTLGAITVEWTYRFTQFDASRSNVQVTLTAAGSKIFQAVAFYRNGTSDTAQFRFPVAAREVPADRTPPIVRITAPADSDSVRVTTMPLTISGVASDSAGVTSVTFVRIKNATRDSAAARGTTTWSIDTIRLDTGLTKIAVRATDAAGNVGTDTIRVRYVTAPIGSAPVIISQPRDTQVVINQAALFKVRATGAQPLTFVWKRRDTTLTGSDSLFRIGMAQYADSGVYSCTVTGANGLSTACTTWSLRVLATAPTDTFTVTASAGTNGTITPFGSVKVARDASRTFTITPATGYHILQILVDGAPDTAAARSGAYTFTSIRANHTISASFAINKYKMTVVPTTGGTVTTNPSTLDSLPHNSPVTLKVTPNATYYFSGWSGGITSTDTPLVITMTRDTSITANFAAIGRFSVNVTPSDTNIVKKIPYQTDYLKGSAVTLVAKPAVGHMFHRWRGSIGAADSTRDTLNLTVDTTKNVAAIFNRITFTIASSVTGAGGSIAPTGTVTINHGADTTFTITPDANYVIQDVKVDNVSKGAVSSFAFDSVTGNRTIVASFAGKPTVGFAAAASEGAEAKSPCSLRVQLSAASTQLTTVTYSIAAGGTATNGSTTVGDYTLTTTTLDIPAGQTMGYIVFTVRNDTINEDDESFAATIAGVTSNAVLIASALTHTYTIRDNDVLTVAFKQDTVCVAEGATASDSVVLNRASEKAMSVTFQRTGGTAMLARDYTLGASPLTFAPMETRKAISVVTIGNGLHTDTNSLVLTLSDPTRGTLGTRVRDTVRIIDADARPGVTFTSSNASSVPEGTNAQFTVTLGSATGRTVQVFYSTEAIAGRAVPGTNYTAVQSSITFDSGAVASKTTNFTVATIANSIDDDSLTFRVRIDSVVRVLGTSRKRDASVAAAILVRIADDEAIPANVLVVNQAATGLGNGLCWRNALTTLKGALDSMAANTRYTQVWVAKGTYKPPTTAGFSLVPGSIYGGFAGGEATLGNRVRSTVLRDNLTTLSGDLNNNGTVESGTDAVQVVDINTYPSEVSVTVDGFRVTGGENGIRDLGRILTIGNCIFENISTNQLNMNFFSYQRLTVTVRNTVFKGNATSMAMLCNGSSAPYCTLTVENSIFFGFGPDYECLSVGAGKHTFRNCTFANNTYAWSLMRAGKLDTLANCLLWNNATNSMAIPSSPLIERCIIDTTGIDPSTVAQWDLNGGWNLYNDVAANAPGFTYSTYGVYGTDNLIGGTDVDGLKITTANGITWGTGSHAPSDDILGSPRNKVANTCTVGAYEQK